MLGPKATQRPLASAGSWGLRTPPGRSSLGEMGSPFTKGFAPAELKGSVVLSPTRGRAEGGVVGRARAPGPRTWHRFVRPGMSVPQVTVTAAPPTGTVLGQSKHGPDPRAAAFQVTTSKRRIPS